MKTTNKQTNKLNKLNKHMPIITGDQVRSSQNEGEVSKALPPEGWVDAVKVRVKKATAKISKSSGNPMFQLDTEIFWPEEVTGGDKKKYTMAGREITYYLPLSEKALDMTLNKVFPSLGLESEVDTENPDASIFDGLCFLTTARTVRDSQMKVDPESGNYVPVTDPDTGEALKGSVKLVSSTRDIQRRCDGPSEE